MPRCKHRLENGLVEWPTGVCIPLTDTENSMKREPTFKDIKPWVKHHFHCYATSGYPCKCGLKQVWADASKL